MVATYVPGPHGPMVFATASNQVTLNALGTETYQANGASMTYTGITILAGTNSALLVVLQRSAAALDASTGVAMTWDTAGGSPTNQALTLLATVGNAGNLNLAQIWGRRAPTTGNKTLSITWTNAAADNFVCGIAFDHVLQTNDAAAFPHTATDGAGSPTVTVTSAAGNMVVGSICSLAPGDSILGTTIYKDITNGSRVNAAADYRAGSTPVVGVGGAATQAIVGVDVQAG